MFNVNQIRKDFPILQRTIYGKPLVYFDNGATTHKPRTVLDATIQSYSKDYSNIHRGVHFLSEQSTESYEEARRKVREFINAEWSQEIIFTSGTTGSINAVAFSFGERYVNEGDEIIVSAMEHHANIVPWQMLCERKKAKLKVIPFDADGILNIETYKKLLNPKTRIVAVTEVSNTLGTINPVKEMIAMAHKQNIPVLVDGAQAVQHNKVDVQDLDCDFYVFSGHKIYGPTGIGVLYGKKELLDEMPPYQGGGDMIECVTFEKTTYNELPFKFEAGTMNFTGAVGLGVALDYVKSIGLDSINAYEHELLNYATQKLQAVDGLKIYGNAPQKTAILSFNLEGAHPYDVGMILDKMGIAVRTGTHCTMPVMDFFGITGTVRASLAFYNTKEEIDYLHDGLLKAKKMLIG
jgi:cysteine desulfurase / selenocysteine lyase